MHGQSVSSLEGDASPLRALVRARGLPLLMAAFLASACGQSKAAHSSSGESAGSSWDAGATADTGTDAGTDADADAGAGAGADADAADGSTPCSPPGTLCWGFEEGTFPPGWSRFRVGDGFAG